MSVELLYRIVQLTQIGGTVKMVLEEVRLVPHEEIERARLEAEQMPEIDVDDAGAQLQKLDLIPEPKNPVEEVFRAMRTQFPEMVEVLKSPPYPSRGIVVRGPAPTSNLIEIYFSPEQYLKLGSPPLLSILKVSLKLET